MCEIKNTLDRIDERLGIVGEKINELEDSNHNYPKSNTKKKEKYKRQTEHLF